MALALTSVQQLNIVRDRTKLLDPYTVTETVREYHVGFNIEDDSICLVYNFTNRIIETKEYCICHDIKLNHILVDLYGFDLVNLYDSIHVDIVDALSRKLYDLSKHVYDFMSSIARNPRESYLNVYEGVHHGAIGRKIHAYVIRPLSDKLLIAEIKIDSPSKLEIFMQYGRLRITVQWLPLNMIWSTLMGANYSNLMRAFESILKAPIALTNIIDKVLEIAEKDEELAREILR